MVLEVDDIDEVEGITCLNIKDSKTRAGLRVVPVATKLIRTAITGHRAKRVESLNEVNNENQCKTQTTFP